jgi:hypothetical protein
VHINKHETHGLDLKTLGSQYERQNYGEVLSSLKQFVAQTPTHPFMDQVHLTISECLAHLGQAAESRQAMREIEKLSAAGPTPDWIVEPFESEDDLMTWFHIPGSSYRHLPIVYCLAVGLKAKRIVDLGIGSTTRALRLAAAQTGGTVSSCDFAKARFAHLATKQDATWSLYLGPSGEFLRQIEGPIDFVMHDAAHDYNQVRQDLELLLPKMRRFGIICIHDTQLAELGNGMLAALTDATRNFETSFTTLPFGCGLTILRMESGAFPNLPVGDYLPDGKTLLTQPIPHPMSPLAAPCAA